jgi:hypothetical protein
MRKESESINSLLRVPGGRQTGRDKQILYYRYNEHWR